MRTVIFDLDGTLADTGADLIAAANACLAGIGPGAMLDPEADRATAFRGGRAMLRLGLERHRGAVDEAEVDRLYPALLAAYEGAIDRHTRLYPGAAEAVERLRGAGYAVGICTNKPERLAHLLMTRLGARHLFASLVGADTLPVRKPDPAPLREAVARAGGRLESAVLVGDSDTDRQTARAAGVPAILVTFGPDGRGVEALAPEGYLHGYDGLAGEVARLIG